MFQPRIFSWLPLTGVLAVAALVGAALMAGAAGDRRSMFALGNYADAAVSVLKERSPDLTLAEVVARPGGAWTDWRHQEYLQSVHGEVMWLRVTLSNPQARELRGVLTDGELFTDRIDLWTRETSEEDAGWRHERAGEWVSADEKPLAGREAVFFVQVPARGERILYLRVEDHFGVWMQPLWWPEERAFLSARERDTWFESVYFGVLLALFVYNSVLWARLRYRDLGCYLGYLAMFGLFMFMFRTQHLVLGYALGSPHAEPVAGFAMAASGFFVVQFAREFLQLRTLLPRVDRWARRLMQGTLLLAVAAFTLAVSKQTGLLHFIVGAHAFTHLLLLGAAVLAWRAGSHQARYFVLSFGLLLVVTVPSVATWLLRSPLGAFTPALMTGSALETLMLSMGLSDRFARLQQDNITVRLAEEKARLEALRYQLNPHFLFNVLNSMYALVYPHSRSCGEAVLRLADFCRSSFAEDGGAPRKLGVELEMVRSYLDIELICRRQRLIVEYQLDPRFDEVLIPPLLLLPLVENAIKHGAATSPGVLTVRLTTRACDADNAVEIIVANTGRWQPPDEPRAVASHGVGLVNLRSRLARTMPGKYRLEIGDSPGWVTVSLRLKK